MNSAGFPCIRCGARRVKLRARAGRTCAYRVFPALTVPAHVGIPTCGKCAAEYIDEPTAARLEPVFAAEYRTELSRRVKQAIAALSAHSSQSGLERLLDISQGYISRLQAGHGNPSPQLVILLALLAQNPDWLQWVLHYWAGPRHEQGGLDRNK